MEKSARLLEFMLYKHSKIGEMITEISLYDAINYVLEIQSKKQYAEIDENTLQKMLVSDDAVKFFNYTVNKSFFVFVSYEQCLFNRINKERVTYFKNSGKNKNK
jgi:hypothetical protein